MSRLNWVSAFAAAGIVVFGTLGYQAAGQSDAKQAEKPMMQCPMMQTMKSIDLHASSPDVLIARAEQLNLSEKQHEKLRAISENARKQALELLNEAQQQQLQAGKSGPLTPMELVKLVAKEDKRGAESGEKKMCPMCQKMMERKKAK